MNNLSLLRLSLPWAKEDLRRGVDTEGRVVEPLECGDHWILSEPLAGINMRVW
jgi:hypothetical protein